jgi:quercetin dioxygenase-like cupin family protein
MLQSLPVLPRADIRGLPQNILRGSGGGRRLTDGREVSHRTTGSQDPWKASIPFETKKQKGTMKTTIVRNQLRPMLAGVIAACGLAFATAWASPGQGTTATAISGPVVLDSVDTRSETDTHEIELKTKGKSDVYVTRIKVVPGGYSGWHSHPGPSIISVRTGTATFYQADDLGTRHEYPTGAGFVEDANRVHLLTNEGSVDLEIIVMQIVPLGAPRRIEAPVPVP